MKSRAYAWFSALRPSGMTKRPTKNGQGRASDGVGYHPPPTCLPWAAQALRLTPYPPTVFSVAVGPVLLGGGIGLLSLRRRRTYLSARLMKQNPVWHEWVRAAQRIYRSMESGDIGAVIKAGRESLRWFTSQRVILRESLRPRRSRISRNSTG